MNTEKLCPLCCQNKTRGTICTECSLSDPSLRWMEAGVEATIRGVPASQARCPQEERVQYKETIYVLQPNIQVVHFQCRSCGTPLALAHVEDEWTNNMFCFCGRQYWVDWQENILHMGLDDEQVAYRLATRLRANGIGRSIS